VLSVILWILVAGAAVVVLGVVAIVMLAYRR